MGSRGIQSLGLVQLCLFLTWNLKTLHVLHLPSESHSVGCRAVDIRMW